MNEAATTPDARSTTHLLLYDGSCGFCASSVQWILRRDRRGTLRFAALQGETARPILARHPELAGVDSVIWVEDAGGAGERVLARSAAALRAARYLEGVWAVAARLGALVPSGSRDWVYDQIAKHRHTLISDPACLLPTPEERARFLP
jgi:predicted DCC family thiol-disulfide oxidoreductase YuxK